jgi:hypothetical protein
MRRLSFPIVIIVSIAIALGLTWLVLGHAPHRGDVRVVQTRSVPPFKRIKVTGSAIVMLVQDASGPVVVEAPRGETARVLVEVHGDTLDITASDRRRWWHWPFRRGSWAVAQITIHFADLEAIEVAGGVSVSAGAVRVPALQIDGAGGTKLHIADLKTTTLRVAGAGALKAELAGQATDQTVSISGAGDYQAAKLISENATVDVSGAGRVVVNASKTLQASISGAGVVEYLGDPEVRESVGGLGRVKRRDAVDRAIPHMAMRGGQFSR